MYDLYLALPLPQVLPPAASLAEAKRTHYGFPGYRQKIEAYGIIAFTLGNTL